jgi:cGMP-dependent protein kinase
MLNLDKSKKLFEFERKAERKISSKFLFQYTETGIAPDDSNLEINESLRQDQQELVAEIFNDLGLWDILGSENQEKLLECFMQVRAPEKDIIYTIGNTASLIYIIDTGSVELTYSDGEVKVLQTGEYFGMEAMDDNQQRTETVKTLQSTVFLCITGDTYRNLKEEVFLREQSEKIQFLKEFPLFKQMDHHKIFDLCDGIIQQKYNQNTLLVQEGYTKDRIYIIQEGSIQVSKSYKKLFLLKKGDYFGEVALFVNNPSFFSYSVNGYAQLLEIPFKTIKQMLGYTHIYALIHKMFLSSIKKSQRIGDDTRFEDINALFNTFKLRYYTTDQIVYSTNIQKNKKICFVVSGRLKRKKSEIVANTGDIFGEEIIDLKKDLDHNIVSEHVSFTLEAEWADVLKNFQSENENASNNLYDTVCRMKKIPLFSSISELKLFQIAKKLKIETYKNRQDIFKDNLEEDKFYIIKTGKVKVYDKRKFIREMEPGSCFKNTNSSSKLSIYANGEVECYVLTRIFFDDLADSALKKFLQNMFALQDIDIDFEDLYYIRNLGSGKFGKVLLVHNKKNLYAVKYASIIQICKKENLIQYFINEKNLMLMTDHPFILKLVKTMKTKNYLIFLLEYIDGITVKNYLEKRKKTLLKNSYETAFYGAILLCVINYLHKKRIIHRDIKPDNIVIEKNGYLKLIDFGVGKQLKDADYTKTCCGTPHYIAPEVIAGKGYAYSADYWSVGVVMFEIFYGYVPFGASTKDIMEIYSEIVNK